MESRGLLGGRWFDMGDLEEAVGVTWARDAGRLGWWQEKWKEDTRLDFLEIGSMGLGN